MPPLGCAGVLPAIVKTLTDELAPGISTRNPVLGAYVQVRYPRWKELVAVHPHLRDNKPEAVVFFYSRLHDRPRGCHDPMFLWPGNPP